MVKKQRKIITIIIEILLAFVFVILVGIRFRLNIFDYKKNIESDSVINIVSLKGIDNTEKVWVTTDNDPNIIVKKNGDNTVLCDITFQDGESHLGKVYYANSKKKFNEEQSLSYVFSNGINAIIIDNDAKFVRLDVVDEKNIGFTINSLTEISRIEYLLNSINYFFVLLLAIIIVTLFEMIRLSVDKKSKITLAFWIILIISLLFIFGNFIMAKNYYIYMDIGSDTFNQYYPYFIDEVNDIRNGTYSLWNWNFGLGTNFMSFSLWALDPFSIPMVLIGAIIGPQSIQYLLVWMQIFKIIVLFILTKKFLGFYLKDAFAINIAAYLTALNGYIMLWGQHYFLGTANVFVLLVFCAIENYIQSECRKGIGYIAFAVGLTLIASFYSGYMILLCAAIYFVFRYLSYNNLKSIKNTIKGLVLCLLAVILGIGISAIIFIPTSYNVFTNTARLSGISGDIWQKIKSCFLASFNLNDLQIRLSRLMSNNMLYINDNSNQIFSNTNYYEMPQLCVSIFIFFFFGQWIIYEIKKIDGVKTLCSLLVRLVLFYLLIFNSVSGLAMNMFATVSFRYTFLVMPFLALCVGIVFQEILNNKKISYVGVLIGFIITLWVWKFAYDNCSKEVIVYVKVLGLILCIGLILLMLINTKINENKYIFYFFACCIIFSSITDAYYTTNHRNTLVKENALQWENNHMSGDTYKAISWLKKYDDTFYRVEKTYSDWTLFSDPLLEGYSAVTSYNSSENANVLGYYYNIYENAFWGGEAWKIFAMDTELQQVANDIADVKYLLSREKINTENWSLIKKINDLYIYKNENVLSSLKWYNNSILKNEYEQMEYSNKADLLMNSVVVDTKQNLSPGSKAVISNFKIENQTRFVCGVECDGSGILMSSIPCHQGWKVWVDGGEAQSIICDYGFLGVKLDEGTHKIIIEYEVPYGKLGFVVSIISIAIMIFVLIYENKTNTKLNYNS